MMSPEQVTHQLCISAGVDANDLDGGSLIGVFQKLRPDGVGVDGKAVAEILTGSEKLDAVAGRLTQVYEIAGDPKRPDGALDAYFIVRNPSPISPEEVEYEASKFFELLERLAAAVSFQPLSNVLSPTPDVRILEGLPPKNPKKQNEKTELLRRVESASDDICLSLAKQDAVADMLWESVYFMACDAFLRDYILWPLYAPSVKVDDPFRHYFQLWKHRVKFRIFGKSQVDFYLPRLDGVI